MRLTLQSKFLIPILALVVIGMGAVTSISFYVSSKAVERAMIGQGEQVALGLSKQLEGWIEDALRDLEEQATRQAYVNTFLGTVNAEGTPDEANTLLQAFVSRYPYFTSVKLTDETGTVFASSIPKQVGNLNVANRSYFKRAMKGKANVSDALRSKATGEAMIVAAAPFRVDGRVKGILYGTIPLSAFSERYVSPVRVGASGYAFVITKAGLVIAHPEKELLFELDIAEFPWGEEMLSKERGVVRYTYDGVEKIAVFEREEKTGWTIITTANIEDILTKVNAIRNTNMLVGCVVVLLLGLVIYAIVRAITKALNKGVTFAETIASGDLEQELTVERSDEIGLLATALRTMVIKLKEMISLSEEKTREAEAEAHKAQLAIKEAEKARAEAESAKREGMLQAAEQLDIIVGEVTSSANLLWDQIDDATQGAGLQRERTTEAATAIEQMNVTVLEVARSAGDAAEHADAAREQAEQGSVVVTGVIEAIGEVDSRTGTLRTSLDELGQRADDIGSVMTVISDIADQTNLLALNAAIEAARAGEAGRGFAVVADEVRKLAEKTMQATKEVDVVIRAIQQSSQENIRGMDDTSKAVTRSTGLVQEAGSALQEIVTIVVANSDQVRSIATASEEQSAASEEISRGAEDVSRIAMETAETMAQAKQAVQRLGELSEQLQNVIAELKQA